MSKHVDYDLIVIGAGGAGMAGAIWAAQAGCKVIILESEDRIGGSTASTFLYDRAYDRELAALDHVPWGARLVTFVGRPCVEQWAMSRRLHLPCPIRRLGREYRGPGPTLSRQG